MEVPNSIEIAKRFWRRKLWLVAPTLVGACLGYLYVKRLEPQYRASTVITVEQQTIRSDFVEETVTTGASDRLRQIEQQVKQAEFLEPIVRELDLYPAYLQSGQIAKAIDKARDDIVFAENRRQRTVTITFSGPGAQLVAKSADRIAEAVIAENLKLRQRQTQATSTFIDERIVEAEKNLRETAAAMTQLKKQWDGRLPEQRQSNERAVLELERQLAAVEESIENAETRRLLLRHAGTPRGISESPPAGPSRLDELRLELQRLRSSFTEKHPDIIRLRNEISILEEAAKRTPRQSAPPDEYLQQDPILEAELQAIDSAIERHRSERDAILSEIRRYRDRLQGVPHIEQELEALQSRYNSYESRRATLLRDQIEAKTAENLEAQGQSERFSILHRAEPPLEPFSPDVLFWLIVGTGLGGAVGVGLVFLRDEMDQTFLDPDSLKTEFPGVAVLATIPNLHEQSNVLTTRARKKRKSA